MVGLAAVAMAKGEAVPRHHVISGTITPDGHIGTVGHMELKMAAASQAGLRTILAPSAAPGGWSQSPSIHVSRASTVRQAYRALMAPQNLLADDHPSEADANRS